MKFEQTREAPVAIIGMACRLPKARNYNEYWLRLIGKENCISEVTSDRWAHQYFSVDDAEDDGSRLGGFIDDIDKFDTHFFGRLPGDARATDPQHRIMLELAWSCLEDSGYPPSKLDAHDIGVYLGVCNYDYKELYDKYSTEIETPYVVGNGTTYLANQISHFFNFSGPSLGVDTACSSSLVAVHHAVTAINRGECCAALAGGVNIMASRNRHLHFHRLGMLSNTGQCYSFDARANGYVRGEGAGLLLLKPLERALQDKDVIHGVIRGSAVNHVGRARTLTSPSTFAQSKVIVKAIETAGVPVDTITHIEAHGTGTPLGDPIEINGLKRAFGALARKQRKGGGHEDGEKLQEDAADGAPFCGVGTAKTNIGHLESAAGVAGLIKVLLSMKHGQLPALQNFQQLNEKINLARSPFYLVTEPRAWSRLTDDEGAVVPRRAGISSFGLGGTNAHMVVEEFINDENGPESESSGENILVLISARNEIQLREYAKTYLDFFSDPLCGIEVPDLSSVAYTTQLGREMMDERLSVICASKDELISKLSGFLADETETPGLWRGAVNSEFSRNFGSDEEDKSYIEQLIRNRNLSKLASLWVQGVNIPWEQLYLDRSERRRVPAPTYPFQKNRHWLPHVGVRPSAVGRTGDGNLLTDRQLIRIGGVERQVRLKSSEWIVAEHQVNGEGILPGVAIIEMVRATVETLSGNENKPITLMDLAWRRPIRVGGSDVDIRVIIEEQRGRKTFRVVSGTPGEGELVHALGEWEVPTAAGSWTRGLSELRTTLEGKRSVEELYARFQDSGMHYGASFQTLTGVQVRDARVVSTLRRPRHGGEGRMKLDVTVLDGALQGIKALPALWESREAWAPFAVERVDILGSVQGDNVAYIESAGEKNGAHVVNIELFDANGAGLVRLTGLQVRPIGAVAAKLAPASELPLGRGQRHIAEPLRDWGRRFDDADRNSLASPAGCKHYSDAHPKILTDESRDTRISQQIKMFIADITGLAIEQIKDDQVFSSYGIDSITGLNLLEKINNRWGIRLKTVVLFDFPTVGKLAAHIVGSDRLKLPSATEEDEASETGDDGDLEKMLLGLKAGELTIDNVLEKLSGEQG
jgi:acyl transferase domain-containing protein